MQKLLCRTANTISAPNCERRRWVPFVVSAPFALALTAQVQAQDLSYMSVEDYVMGASVMTLFHEIGHAFIDRYQIPVLAAEEAAVDAFAVIELLEMQGLYALTPEMTQTYGAWWAASLDTWVRSAIERGPLAFDDYQGEHPVDEQRLFDQICLMYGADRETFAGLAAGYGLDEESRESCGDVYDDTYNSWLQVLENAGALEREVDEGSDVNFVFETPANGGLKRYRTLFEGAEVLDHVHDYISSTYILETPLTVRFLACGEANAFYNLETGEVEMCYELMADYAIYFRGE